MLNDARVYGPSPHSFNPDRFIFPDGPGGAVKINPSIRHPNRIAFGFGRRCVSSRGSQLIQSSDVRTDRICPGSHLAQATLWLTAACMLTLFEFETPLGEKANYTGPDGKVDPRFDPGLVWYVRPRNYPVETSDSTGMNSQPRPFDCDIKVRSSKAATLLEELKLGV